MYVHVIVEAAEDAGAEEAQQAAVLARTCDWQAYHGELMNATPRCLPL
jgi:penicillin V acylase-like amidase (Ntn superfamily)